MDWFSLTLRVRFPLIGLFCGVAHVQESGFTAEEDLLERGGQLCSILYEHAELKLMLDDSGQTDEEMMDKKRAEEELLQTPPPPSDYPSKHILTVSTLHSGNIIACRFNW
jgi:hypothetical protein